MFYLDRDYIVRVYTTTEKGLEEIEERVEEALNYVEEV